MAILSLSRKLSRNVFCGSTKSAIYSFSSALCKSDISPTPQDPKHSKNVGDFSKLVKSEGIHYKQSGPYNLICARGFCSSLFMPHSCGVITPAELLAEQEAAAVQREPGKYEDFEQKVINFNNELCGTITLPGDIFDVPLRKDIVHRVVVWQLAKRRAGNASTKGRSEVSGTGKKPWRQKGTGRARQGSLRGPHFRHGATCHGPKPRDHSIKLQRKVRRLGLQVAVSARAAEGKLVIVDKITANSHRTKPAATYLSQYENCRKFLFIDRDRIDRKFAISIGNIPGIDALPRIGMNVYDIVKHDVLIMSVDAVDNLVEWLRTPIKR